MTLASNERIADHEEAMRLVLEGYGSGLWTCLPCIVDSSNGNTLTCTPAIKGSVRQQDGSIKSVTLPQLVDVPIGWQGGGGLTATFPITAGDECVVIFASRCIDAWWQLGGVQAAMDPRMHSLSDAFALVGVRSQPRALANVSTTAAQLRNDAGTAYIELTPAGAVNIKAPGGVNVTGQITSTGDIIAQLISLLHHVHIDPQGGLTGQPQ